MHNGFIERFNACYRKEILDAYIFFGRYEVRKLTEEWIDKYNHRRPDEGLQNSTPLELVERMKSENDDARNGTN